MAEGLLRHDAGEQFEVESAGTKPGMVRPEAIAAMRELGIDMSGHRSKHEDPAAKARKENDWRCFVVCAMSYEST
jgi:arsenate reductase